MAASESTGKERHDAVTEKFIDEATMLGDDRCHPSEILVEQHKGLFGAESLGDGCEGADIRKEDSHLHLTVVAKLNLGNFSLAEESRKFDRYKARVGFGQGSLLAEKRCLNPTSLAPLFVEALSQGD